MKSKKSGAAKRPGVLRRGDVEITRLKDGGIIVRRAIHSSAPRNRNVVLYEWHPDQIDIGEVWNAFAALLPQH